MNKLIPYLVILTVAVILATLITWTFFPHKFKFENETKGVKEENVQAKDVTFNAETVKFLNTESVIRWKNPPELQKELDDLKKRIDLIEKKAFDKESK